MVFFYYICVMPISVQEINNRCLAKLDAEGSDRYTFDQDIKHAINGTIEEIVTWFNSAFATKKLTPESLRELVKVRVWQTNKFSRVSFDSHVVGDLLWTIVAIYPEIKTNKSSTSASTPSTDAESKFRPEITFVSSLKSAKRLTHEEWNQNSQNAFMPGNSILKGSLSEYGYLDFANYTSTSYVKTDKTEIQIRPDVPNKLIAIAYLKYPSPVSSINDTIEFPSSLTELITEIALNKISVKQGDQTNLFGITSQNINRLISLIR